MKRSVQAATSAGYEPLIAAPLIRRKRAASGETATRLRRDRLPNSAPKAAQQGAGGAPRADGHLVPDWMHKSRFKTSERPPMGALTSTAEPPGGEMFPVIPPPSGIHARG